MKYVRPAIGSFDENDCRKLCGVVQPKNRRAFEAFASLVSIPGLIRQDLTELERHYSQEGAAREYEAWAPFWMAAATAFERRVGPRVVTSARAVFDDQVDRWTTAEGIDLRRSIGAPDWALMAHDEDAGLPNFVQLLFEWGGRLRLGERFLAEGSEFADYGSLTTTGPSASSTTFTPRRTSGTSSWGHKCRLQSPMT